MYEDVYIQHDSYRLIQVQPVVVKTLNDGTEIIEYFWEGAELAEISTKDFL